MPKRARSSVNYGLTGGTGDVNPQFYHGVTTMTGADTTTTGTFNIPIQRLPDSGRAQVMEILKIFVRGPNPVEADSAWQVQFSTKNNGTTTTGFQDPSIFAMSNRVERITTSGQIYTQQIEMIDLTDGAGHGYLLATDNFYVQQLSTNTSVANSCSFKILYRWKNISLAEYIGIGQGQQ